MTEMYNAVWTAIVGQSSDMMKKDPSIVMYTDSQKLFEQNFDYYYNLIVDKFMKLSDEHLDRHKIAAIIICSILKSNVLGISLNSDNPKGNIFLGNEKLALNIALSYMYHELTEEYKLDKIPFSAIYSDYIFPRPLSCDRDYTEVICRDLYYAKIFFELNPLSIANFLFLIEEYSFEASKININIEKMEALDNARKKDQYEKELKNINSTLSELDQKFNYEKKELETRKKDLQAKLENLNTNA